ncbi:MAG TPA: alpha/beta hydrolase-fold protein [Steroidobacteraceae bacterium]|nr:alpha/beta hydrolase-fold protein [Steroidobacteraceae bacterium]
MTPELRELFANGDPKPEMIDAFLKSNRFPIIDPRGVTFVFRGAADSVLLRLWISGLPATQPLEKLGETDLWALRIDLPETSRVEYKFDVTRAAISEWITDPLNPVKATDPFGANSVCQGYGYERPAWTQFDPLARAGAVDELVIGSEAFGERRRVRAYLPARFRRSRRYPLLIVHDGDDYLHFADFKIVLDNLIHRLEIPPLVVALTQSPDRLKEYAGDERHARFIAKEVLPAFQQRFPLRDEPAQRVLMGASFGAVAALHAAWSNPGVFGGLLLESGSFAFSDIGQHRRTPVFDPVVRFVNDFRRAPGETAQRIYMSCGIYESLIYENRSLVPLLTSAGIQVRFEEARDAHNWENWRDRLQAGLTWLLPGPLWMVYE